MNPQLVWVIHCRDNVYKKCLAAKHFCVKLQIGARMYFGRSKRFKNAQLNSVRARRAKNFFAETNGLLRFVNCVNSIVFPCDCVLLKLLIGDLIGDFSILLRTVLDLLIVFLRQPKRWPKERTRTPIRTARPNRQSRRPPRAKSEFFISIADSLIVRIFRLFTFR